MSETVSVVDTTATIVKLREFILDNFFFGVETVQYNDDDSLMQKGIVDSTGILELITYVEETYDIAIEDDELVPENLDTLKNLAAFIARKS